MSKSRTQTINIAAPPASNSPDIHHFAIRLQHLASTVKSSRCPSNLEGLGDSLGGSGLSLFFFARVASESAAGHHLVLTAVSPPLTTINQPSYNHFR